MPTDSSRTCKEGHRERIRSRSRGPRQAYLARVAQAGQRRRGAERLGCANVAHAFAALPANDKLRVVAEQIGRAHV